MRPTSLVSSPLIAGQAVRIAATVRRVLAPNAGMMTGPGTNTYLLGERELAVIDPGPDDPGHLAAILEAAAGASIRWILVTHTHRDHSPLAARLAAATGAPVVGRPAPQDGRQDETFVATHIPADGEILVLAECEVRVLHTPGHASNCVCYLAMRDRLLFTGDHVLQGVSPVILAPDGDMHAYLESLRKLPQQEFDRIAPGHGDIVAEPAQAVRLLLAHRLAREAKVWRVLDAAGTATLEALTPLVYDDVDSARHGYAQLTLRAHLVKLAHDGRVREHDGHWQALRQ